MRYLIDGHNLIPKLPGLSLHAVDDETRLVEWLQEYCRSSRNQVEVYFDNAPTGNAGARKYGTVIAHFVAQGRTADDAIRARLEKLGRDARNWAVVSSDQRVQADARAAHAQSVSSEQFARELLAKPGSSTGIEKPSEEALNEAEVTAWLEVFTQRNQKPKK
jgi:predicted RNA-binding protein with PIN domain